MSIEQVAHDSLKYQRRATRGSREPFISVNGGAVDDQSLAVFVNRLAQRISALQPVERWDSLARLHASLVDDLRAMRIDRDLAAVQADFVIEAVLGALSGGDSSARRPIGPISSSPSRPPAVPVAVSP
jgi:hypothetical protein